MKKILFISSFFVLGLLSSCNNEELESAGSQAEETAIVANEKDYVFGYKVAEGSEVDTRAFMLKNKQWDVKEIIHIKFLNGSELAKNRVKEVAADWLRYANLKFNYVESSQDADVRIGFGFNGDRVTWSYIGTDCFDVGRQNQPTMNIRLLDQNDATEINSDEFTGLILKAFGHMLGLVYEHQGPGVNLNLDDNRLTSYFRPFGWTDEQIDKLMDVYNSRNINSYSKYDENSIMVLYIPNHLTTDGKGLEKFNTRLSDKDKEIIGEIYPYPPCDCDPYQRGDVRNLYMTMATGYSGGYGLRGYNYDTETPQDWGLIEKTYKTQVIGEYEWTAENLKIKYWNLWGTLYNFMNHSQAKINAVIGPNNTCTVKEFEDIFGTWVTNYLEGLSYRNGNYHFYLSKGGEEITGFDLPENADLLQLIGQMPVNYNRVYADFQNFVYAAPGDVSQTFNLPYMNKFENISGMTATPVGFKGNNDDDSGVHYSFGYGFGWQMKNYAHIFTCSDIHGIGINDYLYHFTQARYCRKLSDQELRYKLYVDESKDEVVVLRLTDHPGSMRELEKGLERGIALRYMDRGRNLICKDWSFIQAEAQRIRQSIRIN